MSSKATQQAPQAPAPTMVEATYSWQKHPAPKGSPKGTKGSITWFAAFDPAVGMAVTPGTLVRINAAYGGSNYGKLTTPRDIEPTTIGKGDNARQVVRWQFDQLTPDEHRAIGIDPAANYQRNRVLKAQAQAAFAGSDRGKETADKVIARVAKRQAEQAQEALAAQEAHDAAMVRAQNVAAHAMVPSVSKVQAAVQAPQAQVAQVATSTPTLAEMIAALISAGMPVADAATQAVATLAALSTPAPQTPAQVAPTAPVLAPRPSAVKPVAVKTQVPAASKTTGKGKHSCPSCGDQEATRLYDHVAGVKVCDSCMNLDAATVTTRVVKRAEGASK